MNKKVVLIIYEIGDGKRFNEIGLKAKKYFAEMKLLKDAFITTKREQK